MLISHVQELLIHDRQSNGYSPRTIDRYVVHINQFIEYTGDIDIKKLEQHHIDDYKLHLLNKIRHENNPNAVAGGKLSRSTINSYLKEVYTLINFAKKKQYKIDKTLETKYVKEEHRVIDVLNEEEIYMLSNLPENTYLQVRNKLMIYLMLDSGLRVQEVENAMLDSIDLNYQCIVITKSKGMKSRKVPLSDMTMTLYFKYRNLRPTPIIDNLFLNLKNEPITYSSIKSMLFRTKINLGLERLNPHYLRHTFATRYLIEQLLENQQADVFTLMQILGHSSIETTMVYLHTAKMYLLQGHKYSPLERIKSRKIESFEKMPKSNVVRLYKNNKTL